jgi:transketolase-like protein
MEGIGAEAASLAGHLQLSNLCWIYDSNRITIEGGTDLTFSKDVAVRFSGYGWAVQHVSDANDLDAVAAAFAAFRAETSRPTLIVVDSDRPPTASGPAPARRCSAVAIADPHRHRPSPPGRAPRPAAAGRGGGDTARPPA